MLQWRMAWLLLIAVLLAQSGPGVFVRFERCYLDLDVSPPEFRPYNPSRMHNYRDSTFSVRVGAVQYISDPESGVGGIACTRIGTANGNAFVIGTSEEVRAKLRKASQ